MTAKALIEVLGQQSTFNSQPTPAFVDVLLLGWKLGPVTDELPNGG